MTTDQLASAKPFSVRLDEAIARERATGIEICTSCARDMDFPSSLHYEHPTRSVNGAYYCEGGQTCATCAAAQRQNQKSYAPVFE